MSNLRAVTIRSRMKKTGVDPMLIVTGVESVTVRAVLGDGDQLELHIRTRNDDLTLRLIPRSPKRAIRVTNLRRRDRKATPKTSVPFLNGQED